MGIRSLAGDERGLTRTCPHLPLMTFPPLLEGLSSFMSVDSATSPLVSRRMTGGREHTVKMEGLGLEESTKRESGVMGIGFY